MRKSPAALLAVFVLVFAIAGVAAGQPIATGSASAGGWHITAPGISDPNLTPSVSASYPCPPATNCQNSQNLTSLVIGDPLAPTAAATLLADTAQAFQESTLTATLQTTMQAAAPALALPSGWNTRGFSRVEGFSALNGQIAADTIEAEAVFGSRANGTAITASGVRVVNLRLSGALAAQTLAPIVADLPNQVLLDAAGVKIIYWETNWNRTTGLTTDGQPLFVNALRITAPGGIDIKVATATVTGAFPIAGSPPPPPAPPPANAPPDAVDDSASTQINDPVVVNVTANDTDPEGNLVQSVTVTQQPANGTVTCVNNLCTYTPNNNFVGTDTFTYQVCDNVGQCDTATVTITVTNAAPVAQDDSATTTSGTAVTVPVATNDSDVDGNLVPASVTVTKQPTSGIVICSNGSCSYTPNPAFVGTDTFEYSICDTKNLCDTAVVTITVSAPVGGGGGTPANQPPAAVNDSATTTQSTAATVNVIGNDTDSDDTIDPASVAVLSGPSNGAVVCNNSGSCTYTPNSGFAGTDSFVYRVCDDDLACASATVTMTVAGAAPAGTNQPPVAVDDSRATDQNAAVTLNVLNNDSDPDGNLVPSATVVRHPSNGSVTCTGASCTYTPNSGFSGTDTFDYRVCDTQSACSQATVTITVAPPPGPGVPTNQPPVAADDIATTTAGTLVALDVTRNDSDPDNNLSDTVAVVRHPANGAVICNQGECTYTPAPGFSGTDTFDYRICDTSNLCDTATVTVTVAPGPSNARGAGNNPPVARDDSATTKSGVPVLIGVTANDSDPDGNLDVSTVAVTQAPAHGAVICTVGSCTYTPAPGYSGPDSFEYRVCDTLNACATATVNIVVEDAPGTADNQPPVARDDAVTTRPGQPVTIPVTRNDSDPDGELDLTTVTVTVPPDHGSVICIEGRCTYTPDRGFEGQDDFEYRVCDTLGACTTAVVTVNVPAPNPNLGTGDGGGSGGPRGRGPGKNNNDENDAPGGRDRLPALPGDTPPNAPISLDSPLLGAPNAPLPFTGGEPSFYLGAALNLLLIGMLLILIERFSRAGRSLRPCPAWHNHEEAHDSNGCAFGEWRPEPRAMLLLIDRFRRSTSAPKPCPSWHNHEEAHGAKGCAYGEWS